MTGRPTRARSPEDLARPLGLGLMGERCWCEAPYLPQDHPLGAHSSFRKWLRRQVTAGLMTPSGRLLGVRQQTLADFAEREMVR